MKSSALVAMLQMPESTVRKYAHDYAEFLSAGGTGGAGRHRDYTDHDARVLKLVRDMKLASQSNESIDATLRSLEARDWERLPDLDESAKSIIPAPGMLIEVQQEKAVMQKEIELLREQIADLKAERADRDELIRRLAEAETMLRLYESGKLKPPK